MYNRKIMRPKDAAHRTCDIDTLKKNRAERDGNENEKENEIGRQARLVLSTFPGASLTSGSVSTP